MSCNINNMDNLTQTLIMQRLGISRNMRKVRDMWLSESESDSSDSDSTSNGSNDSYDQYPGICSDDFISKCSCSSMVGNSHHCSAIFRGRKKQCFIRRFDGTK